ncbi:MAG TPA: alkaline phosphatase family protein [Candidatus Tumulicola sp.]|nr:alkaline phosphatase family protein [Candidatus Tumulicola sp.]
MHLRGIGWCAIAMAAGALLSGCGGGAPAIPSAQNPAGVAAFGRGLSSKIQHVVVIVQENRSFDDLFHGYPGADARAYGYTSDGTKVALKPVPFEDPWDIDHSAKAYFAACDGSGSLPGTNCKMDGFDKEGVSCGGVNPPCPYPHPQYAYVPHSETKPYFALAQQYVLADKMFASNFDGSSFVSHQYLIAAQASSTVDYPLTTWGCDGGPQDTIDTITQQRVFSSPIVACFDNQTLGDEMDAAGISWRYYTTNLYGSGNLWSAYQAIKHIRYGPDWKKNVVSPQTRFFKDVANGRLPQVSWVTPTWKNSDHAGSASKHGPAWVASLVNAIGNSPYWNSTAIFILWDDYGGWYDHVPPPLKDYDGLGIRVPMLIVSPYAKQNYVSHVQYEEGSILRFVEDTFGLAQLAASDTRATSPAKDCFNFGQAPRPFVTIKASPTEEYFMHEQPDLRPPDNY